MNYEDEILFKQGVKSVREKIKTVRITENLLKISKFSKRGPKLKTQLFLHEITFQVP